MVPLFPSVSASRMADSGRHRSIEVRYFAFHAAIAASASARATRANSCTLPVSDTCLTRETSFVVWNH